MTSVLLAAESLAAGNSGIGRVARLMARVLVEEVQTGRLSAQTLALNDSRSVTEFSVPAQTAGGSRTRFVWQTHRAALRHTHFIYDFLGMARAHSRLPFLRRPFLTWIHGVDVWESARPDRLAWARRADTLLSNSAYTRDRADRLHSGFSRATVCWLATDTDETPPLRSARRGPPTVLLVSRLDVGGGYKGHRELIDAWPKVVSCVPDARLIVVGRGPGLAVVEQWAAQSPARARIELRGFLSESELGELWTEANVFAMPSRGEGFGLVYIEAMRQGLPVVASIHDAATEVNLDGITGFNVDLEKPDELPERIVFLLREPARAEELGRQGQLRWREHFCYSRFRERFRPSLHQFLQS